VSDSTLPFWQRKRLAEMTPEEWESLCDGCGQCCLYKFEDEDTNELLWTPVVCRFLDLGSVRCKVYAERSKHMPTCIQVTPENAGALRWMPETCAYRLLAEGKSLPDWHPLVSGDPQSVKASGHSVTGRAISEDTIDIDHLEDYIIDPDEER
jgi:uncharacterized cysteine cluster protein YcgN (CxxCxxCC family)